MPKDMTEFERYLIERIDGLEGKIADLNLKMTYIYAVAGVIGTIASFVVNFLTAIK